MWLSLVEHLVRDEGVGGSNPLIPTTKKNKGFQLYLKVEDLFYSHIQCGNFYLIFF